MKKTATCLLLVLFSVPFGARGEGDEKKDAAKEVEAAPDLSGAWNVISKGTDLNTCKMKPKTQVQQWLLAADTDASTAEVTVIGETGFPKLSGTYAVEDGKPSIVLSGASAKMIPGFMSNLYSTSLVMVKGQDEASFSGIRYYVGVNDDGKACMMMLDVTGKKQ